MNAIYVSILSSTIAIIKNLIPLIKIKMVSYYISCSYKTLLQRSLSREGNIPDTKVLEMCRRLQSDYEIVEVAKKDKDIILLDNETQQDFINAVLRITENGDN